MARILYESSSFQEYQNISGVGYYAKMLAHELGQHHHIMYTNGPFGTYTTLNKIYRKAASYRLAPPFELLYRPYSLALFPNFASFPTTKARKRAVVIHDLAYLKHPESVQPANLAYLKRVVPHSIHNCDYVITVSETVKREIVTEFSIDSAKVVVTPIPPRKEIIEGNKNQEVHKKYGIPTKKYFLFIGNLEPRKNVDNIIDSYLKLSDKIRREYSLIIGGGGGWNSTRTLTRIKELETRFNIRHIGYVDDQDMTSMYAQATAFLFASCYEGFGMPILESIACGTPVITSDIPVFREILGDKISPTAESSTLSEQIMEILDKDKIGSHLQDQLGVLDRYSWEKNVKSIERLL